MTASPSPSAVIVADAPLPTTVAMLWSSIDQDIPLYFELAIPIGVTLAVAIPPASGIMMTLFFVERYAVVSTSEMATPLGYTVTVNTAETSPYFMVIFAVPAFSPVTVPTRGLSHRSTLAIVGSELVQITCDATVEKSRVSPSSPVKPT